MGSYKWGKMSFREKTGVGHYLKLLMVKQDMAGGLSARQGLGKAKVKVTQSYLTLRDSMDNSPGQNTGVGSRSLLQRTSSRMVWEKEFLLDGPVVKTRCSHNRDPGLIPNWGTRILQSRKLGQKKKKKKSDFGGLRLKDDKSLIREGSRDWKERVGGSRLWGYLL